jgi:hypothetical protein
MSQISGWTEGADRGGKQRNSGMQRNRRKLWVLGSKNVCLANVFERRANGLAARRIRAVVWMTEMGLVGIVRWVCVGGCIRSRLVAKTGNKRFAARGKCRGKQERGRREHHNQACESALSAWTPSWRCSCYNFWCRKHSVRIGHTYGLLFDIGQLLCVDLANSALARCRLRRPVCHAPRVSGRYPRAAWINGALPRIKPRQGTSRLLAALVVSRLRGVFLRRRLLLHAMRFFVMAPRTGGNPLLVY